MYAAVVTAMLGASPAAADILVESVPGSGTQVMLDVRHERVGDGAWVTLQTTASLESARPDRWYYGWLWRSEAGMVGFEFRADDAGPPEEAFSRIVTAVRTGADGAIDPYRQIGQRVWFDRDLALLHAASSDDAWIERGFGADDPADGGAPAIPIEVAPLWFARAGAMRNDSAGVGLAQVSLGAGGGPPFSTTVKGYAHVESSAAVHAQDELPVAHRPGVGTYVVRTHADSRANLHVTGFLLGGAGHFLAESTSAQTVHAHADDVHVTQGIHATVEADVALPATVPDRWFLGWLWADGDGAAGFEFRLDDAGPPRQPYARVVTAARTGPDGAILPAYRQIDERIWFDADVGVLQRQQGTSSWEEASLVPVDAAFGSAPMVPLDHAPLWYCRAEAMRASGLDVGIGQITIGMLATTGAGAFSTQIKGFAQSVDAGAGHGQDEVPVHHRLGRGTFGFYLNQTAAVNVFATGFVLGVQGHAIVETDDEDSDVLHVDLQDVHVADGRFATIHEVVSVEDADAGAWHRVWVWVDAAGTVGLELRGEEDGPPAQPHRRIVTSFQTSDGGSIAPRFRQFDGHVWFDGDLTFGEYVDGSGWVEDGLDPIDTDYVGKPMIPSAISPLWYTRTEVVNEPDAGPGLAEIALGMRPGDEGSFSTTIRGFADTQPPGSVFVNDELPVHHELERGTFSYRVSDRTLTNILIAGYEILGGWPSEAPDCTPTAEVDATCDGMDDDCDGMIDEDVAEPCVCPDFGTSEGDGGGASEAGGDGETDGGSGGLGPPGGDGAGPASGCACTAVRGAPGGSLPLLLLAIPRRRQRRRRRSPSSASKPRAAAG
jgi:hypothetical protein